MYAPITLRQFRRRFHAECDYLRYLIKRKWPDGFRCHRCSHNRAYVIESGKGYRCTRCWHQTSVTAHTIFHKTRKGLRDWFWAIFIVATRTTGSSARQLQRGLGLSYQTAWTWCHKIRKARQDCDTRYTLRGVIELDDTYVGGKKKPGKRGRGARSKVPLIVAGESRSQVCEHVTLSKVQPFSSQQAKIFLHQKVRNDSIITSDGLYLYRPLAGCFNLCQIPAGDAQRVVKTFPDVHRLVALLKTWIQGTHSRVSNKHLNQYLAKFTYRFNRRSKQRRTTIFDRLVTAYCATQTVTYRQLVANLS